MKNHLVKFVATLLVAGLFASSASACFFHHVKAPQTTPSSQAN